MLSLFSSAHFVNTESHVCEEFFLQHSLHLNHLDIEFDNYLVRLLTSFKFFLV
jgi:hypothetical protein